jgi:hypothetical protein
MGRFFLIAIVLLGASVADAAERKQKPVTKAVTANAKPRSKARTAALALFGGAKTDLKDAALFDVRGVKGRDLTFDFVHGEQHYAVHVPEQGPPLLGVRFDSVARTQHSSNPYGIPDNELAKDIERSAARDNTVSAPSAMRKLLYNSVGQVRELPAAEAKQLGDLLLTRVRSQRAQKWFKMSAERAKEYRAIAAALGSR